MPRKKQFTFGTALPPQRPFKKGDKVYIIIRKTTNESPSCTSEMVKIAKKGEVHKVVGVITGNVCELSCNYYWHPKWLQRVEAYDSL